MVRVHSLALSAAGAFRQRLVAPVATLQTLSDAEDDLLLGFHVSNVSELSRTSLRCGWRPAPLARANEVID